MKKEYIKPFVWGLVLGAIVLLIVIFWSGWAVTNGSAQAKTEEAFIDQLAAICVVQFQQDPNRSAQGVKNKKLLGER